MAKFLTTTDSSAAIERVRWSPEEDRLILEIVEKGMARLAISEVLDRQPSAIESRILKLRE